MNKISKAALALNLAGIIRAVRFGLGDSARKLVDAYEIIDPLGNVAPPSAQTLQQMATIPVHDLREVVNPLPIVRIDSGARLIDGALPPGDLAALLALLNDWKPELILEIGTYFGQTTRTIALNAPEATIHTVDLPQDFDPLLDTNAAMPKDDFHLIKQRRVGEAFALTPESKRIVQHFVDTATWDFQPIKGATFFFIDGAHTYPYAKNDTEKCLSVAAPRSRFLWHDFDERHPEVVRYLYELKQQGSSIVRIKGTSLAFCDYNL